METLPAPIAPFTVAWIETRCGKATRTRRSHSPLHGGVDRNDPEPGWMAWVNCRPLHGGVDRNCAACRSSRSATCRPLHGGVDRNSVTSAFGRIFRVAPFTWAWIETRRSPSTRTPTACRPFTGAWIETRSRSWSFFRSWSPPSRGRGSKPDERCPRFRRQQSPPFTGAWIETSITRASSSASWSRPLLGGVDQSRQRASGARSGWLTREDAGTYEVSNWDGETLQTTRGLLNALAAGLSTVPARVSQARDRYPLRRFTRSALHSCAQAPQSRSTSSTMRRSATNPSISASRWVSEVTDKSARKAAVSYRLSLVMADLLGDVSVWQSEP
ncbi:hypothetical protein SAMN05421757_11524 [Tropicimonas sediminicola]|uniref:Uncharacterized protein n=1 Tax=Tropicimonas sediminicola TaxID=1031541 RepID=A0A239MAH5_9RHOB|nr:hypothetical protein SAMN05421757_11524 [Tropicimonas sediminicola]